MLSLLVIQLLVYYCYEDENVYKIDVATQIIFKLPSNFKWFEIQQGQFYVGRCDNVTSCCAVWGIVKSKLKIRKEFRSQFSFVPKIWSVFLHSTLCMLSYFSTHHGGLYA